MTGYCSKIHEKFPNVWQNYPYFVAIIRSYLIFFIIPFSLKHTFTHFKLNLVRQINPEIPPILMLTTNTHYRFFYLLKGTSFSHCSSLFYSLDQVTSSKVFILNLFQIGWMDF